MTTHIALLRAVNVGAHNPVAMGDLCAMAAKLGLLEPRTLLQSGNLIFRSDAPATGRLEQLLEAAAAKHLGLRTDFYVRTAREWQAIIAGNPFPKESRTDPSHLLVMSFKRSLEPAAVGALQKAITGREVVRARGREAYITYPDGIGTSRLTAGLIARMLGQEGTARNWNTVGKLGAAAGETGITSPT